MPAYKYSPSFNVVVNGTNNGGNVIVTALPILNSDVRSNTEAALLMELLVTVVVAEVDEYVIDPLNTV
jgi:hypothetical protein